MKRKVPIKCSAYLDNELIFENRFLLKEGLLMKSLRSPKSLLDKVYISIYWVIN